MSYIRRSDSGFSLHRPGFDSDQILMRCVMDYIASISSAKHHRPMKWQTLPGSASSQTQSLPLVSHLWPSSLKVTELSGLILLWNDGGAWGTVQVPIYGLLMVLIQIVKFNLYSLATLHMAIAFSRLSELGPSRMEVRFLVVHLFYINIWLSCHKEGV
jgi:hypothetical protein